MSTFWIIGIVLNVVLTIAALIWIFRQMRPRAPDPTAADKPQKNP